MDKTCSRCRREFPAEDFNRDRRNTDGLNFWCRECQRTYMAGYYAGHRAAYRARQRRWRAADPARRRAHAAVEKALKSGGLWPEPCEICGASVAEAHHEDYGEPLRVIWLCQLHHKRLHARRREREERRAARLALERQPAELPAAA